MLNSIIIIGKIKSISDMTTLENGDKVVNLVVEIPRPYKSSKGVVESDFIDCVLWRGLANELISFGAVNQMIGLKGMLQARRITKVDGNEIKTHQVFVESITYLTRP